MKFSALAALVACIPALVKAAGQGNPWEGATTFLIPEYIDEVKAAAAEYVQDTKSILTCCHIDTCCNQHL